MSKEEKKRKSIGKYLTYAYIRKIKKWMFCPNCQHGKMTINKKFTVWTCEDCGYKLSADEFEDDYVFWFCDECNAYLNNQEGFERQAAYHICTKCGYENDTSIDNIKGICLDCGKIIPDPEATLCADCKQARKEKAKEQLTTAGKVVGTVAAVAGLVYLASQSTESSESTGYTPLPDSDDDDNNDLVEETYPTCKTCGAEMTEFDGWAWYTCPDCGDSVRIIDGIETWHDEIFREGTKEHRSDFELADFCRGGDLTED